MVKYLNDHPLGSQRNGVNHVQMNLGSFNEGTGPARGTNYPVFSDALLDWYLSKNIKSVRIPFTWEAVQGAKGGPVPATAMGPGYADYWRDLVAGFDPATGKETGLVKRFLARGIYVILSPWQFNPVSGDTDIVYKGAAFTKADFADFWGKFANAINGVTGNDQRVAFDLINEPHTHVQSGNKLGDIGISLTDWFECAQAAITAIRATGAANTIFVPGMSYAAASAFTTNGSSTEWESKLLGLTNIAVTVHCYDGVTNLNDVRSTKPDTVLRDACSSVVTWARGKGIKVNVGEIAIDAGVNGLADACGTLSTAQRQWDDWNHFCIANNDVLVGWNWWANSAPAPWWNAGDSCNANGNHWGLTLNDGATQTVYMNLIANSLAAPFLRIRDNLTDAGQEPNSTTGVGWESPDVWVRQVAEDVDVGQDVQGGVPSVVYVRVRNDGPGAYPADGNDVVRLCWAKAESGLSWPAPWNGAIPLQGGLIGADQPVGSIPPGANKKLQFDWPNTPDPANYANKDGHFCLLALIVRAGSPTFADFDDPNLNTSVLQLSTVAWRNIHILSAAPKKIGTAIASNRFGKEMLAQLTFEILDAEARPIDPKALHLVISPSSEALERLREQRHEQPFLLAAPGHGQYRLSDSASGIPRLLLRSGEALSFDLAYAPPHATESYAIRVTQHSHEGIVRSVVGGQTFVAGSVEGFTRQRHPRKRSWWERLCALLCAAGACRISRRPTRLKSGP